MARRHKHSPKRYDDGLLGSSRRSRTDSSSGALSKEYRLSERRRPKNEDGSFFHGTSEQLDLLLPQPLTDDSVKHEVAGFFAVIEQHAENFYHERPFDDSISADHSGHQRRELPPGIFAQGQNDFGPLLADPGNRLSAISCLICSEMLDSINVKGYPAKSLLPPVVTRFLQSIRAPKERSQGKFAHVV